MNTFRFTKMHGLGNDFVVIDNVRQSVSLNPDRIRALSDRRLGVGCDQVLILSPAKRHGDFHYAIFNADGSEAAHCGNGARCLAQFVADEGLSQKKTLHFEMHDHMITTTRMDDQQISVAMPKPRRFEAVTVDDVLMDKITVANPHAIISTPLDDATFLALAQRLQTDPHFVGGVNVSLIKQIDAHQIAIRTFERGAGLTPACGSAAVAAAFLAVDNHWVDDAVQVNMPGGHVTVAIEKDQVILTGPATRVFEGTWYESAGS